MRYPPNWKNRVRVTNNNEVLWDGQPVGRISSKHKEGAKSPGGMTTNTVFLANGQEYPSKLLAVKSLLPEEKVTTTAWPMSRPANDATYTTATDFRDFVAFGLGTCWVSPDPGDVDADCHFARPFTTDDVDELRGFFLNALENTIYGLWTGDFQPGQKDYLDLGGETLIVDELDADGEATGRKDTTLSWLVRLDADSLMMELNVSNTDPTCLFLDYAALLDRETVVEVLTEARKFVFNKKVYPDLAALKGK